MKFLLLEVYAALIGYACTYCPYVSYARGFDVIETDNISEWHQSGDWLTVTSQKNCSWEVRLPSSDIQMEVLILAFQTFQLKHHTLMTCNSTVMLVFAQEQQVKLECENSLSINATRDLLKIQEIPAVILYYETATKDLVNVVKFTDSYNVIPFVRAYLRNQKSPTHALWVLPEVPIGQRMFLVFLDIFQQRGCDSDALWLTRLNLSYKSTVDFKYCNKVTSGSFTKSIGPSLRSILTVHSAPCNKSCVNRFTMAIFMTDEKCGEIRNSSHGFIELQSVCFQQTEPSQCVWILNPPSTVSSIPSLKVYLVNHGPWLNSLKVYHASSYFVGFNEASYSLKTLKLEKDVAIYSQINSSLSLSYIYAQDDCYKIEAFKGNKLFRFNNLVSKNREPIYCSWLYYAETDFQFYIDTSPGGLEKCLDYNSITVSDGIQNIMTIPCGKAEKRFFLGKRFFVIAEGIFSLRILDFELQSISLVSSNTNLTTYSKNITCSNLIMKLPKKEFTSSGFGTESENSLQEPSTCTTISNILPQKSQKSTRTWFILIPIIGSGILLFCSCMVVFFLYFRKKSRKVNQKNFLKKSESNLPFFWCEKQENEFPLTLKTLGSKTNKSSQWSLCNPPDLLLASAYNPLYTTTPTAIKKRLQSNYNDEESQNYRSSENPEYSSPESLETIKNIDQSIKHIHEKTVNHDILNNLNPLYNLSDEDFYAATCNPVYDHARSSGSSHVYSSVYLGSDKYDYEESNPYALPESPVISQTESFVKVALPADQQI